MRTKLGENEPDWHLTPAKEKPLWDLKGQKPTDERKTSRIKRRELKMTVGWGKAQRVTCDFTTAVLRTVPSPPRALPRG